MKNKLVLYANLLKENLKEKGFTLVKQTFNPFSEGVLLTFNRNGREIRSDMVKVNCEYRLEIKTDTFSVYLFYN